MKKFRLISAVLALSSATLFSVNAVAQASPSAPIQVIFAGSSAMFADTGYTATDNSSTYGQVCGPYIWTGASNAASITSGPYIYDSRNSAILNEPGNVWISWNGSANATTVVPTKVCAYISVDSAVGVRAAMANPTASLVIGNAAGAADAGKLTALSANAVVTTLPAFIANLFAPPNGQPITVGATDVRPEDAKFATVRALSALGGALNDPSPYAISNGLNPMGTQLFQTKGLGYASTGNANIGVSIKSTQANGNVANAVNFATFSQDPFSSNTIDGSWVTVPVGAGPIVFFVNATSTGSGHLGDGNCTNINLTSICGALDGTFQRNVDICEPANIGSTATPVFGIPVFEREPLSGTYNTTEFSTAGSFSCFTTQENGVNPTASNGNPMNIPGSISNSYRARVITTGEDIKTVGATADALGYAFWGYGNFTSGNHVANLKYLTVNGVDPLYANSGTGANPNGQGVFPVGSGTPVTYPTLTFPNINNGTYRIWTTARFLVPNISVATGQNAQAWANIFAQVAQTDAAAVYSDFVPNTSLTVMHDHFYNAWSGVFNSCTPDANGVYHPYPTEEGGDMGGDIYSCTQLNDYANTYGVQLQYHHM